MPCKGREIRASQSVGDKNWKRLKRNRTCSICFYYRLVLPRLAFSKNFSPISPSWVEITSIHENLEIQFRISFRTLRISKSRIEIMSWKFSWKLISLGLISGENLSLVGWVSIFLNFHWREFFALCLGCISRPFHGINYLFPLSVFYLGLVFTQKVSAKENTRFRSRLFSYGIETEKFVSMLLSK